MWPRIWLTHSLYRLWPITDSILAVPAGNVLVPFKCPQSPKCLGVNRNCFPSFVGLLYRKCAGRYSTPDISLPPRMWGFALQNKTTNKEYCSIFTRRMCNQMTAIVKLLTVHQYKLWAKFILIQFKLSTVILLQLILIEFADYQTCRFCGRIVERGYYSEKDAAEAIRQICDALAVS